jgi:hypothetical protein
MICADISVMNPKCGAVFFNDSADRMTFSGTESFAAASSNFNPPETPLGFDNEEGHATLNLKSEGYNCSTTETPCEESSQLDCSMVSRPLGSQLMRLATTTLKKASLVAAGKLIIGSINVTSSNTFVTSPTIPSKCSEGGGKHMSAAMADAHANVWGAKQKYPSCSKGNAKKQSSIQSFFFGALAGACWLRMLQGIWRHASVFVSV